MSEQTTPDDAMEAALPVVSPGAVLRAMEDPTIFAETARGDLYVQLGLMRKIAADKNFPVVHRLEYAKFLAKMGKVDQPDPTQLSPTAGLPMIQIVFPNSGQTTTIAPTNRVIDVTPDDE